MNLKLISGLAAEITREIEDANLTDEESMTSLALAMISYLKDNGADVAVFLEYMPKLFSKTAELHERLKDLVSLMEHPGNETTRH